MTSAAGLLRRLNENIRENPEARLREALPGGRWGQGEYRLKNPMLPTQSYFVRRDLRWELLDDHGDPVRYKSGKAIAGRGVGLLAKRVLKATTKLAAARTLAKRLDLTIEPEPATASGKPNKRWADDAPGNAKADEGATTAAVSDADAGEDGERGQWDRPQRHHFIPMVSPHWLLRAIDLGKPEARLALFLCWRGAANKYRPLTLPRRHLVAWGTTNKKVNQTLDALKGLIAYTKDRRGQYVIRFRLPATFEALLRKRAPLSTPTKRSRKDQE